MLQITALLAGALYVPLPSSVAVGRWWVIAAGVAVCLWRVRVHSTAAHWQGLALLVWALLSALLWSVSPPDSLLGVLQFAIVGMVFVVAAEAGVLEVRDAWQAFAAGVNVSACVSIAQWLGWHPVWELQPGTGLFLYSGGAGCAAALAVIGAMGVRAWPLAVLPAASLLILPSRAVLLALGVAGLTSLYLGIHWESRRRLLALYAIAGACLVPVWAYGALGYLGKTWDRFEIWGAVLPHVNIWGDGLGSFQIAFQGYEFAHNEFIHFAFELGVGSLLLWGVVWHALRKTDLVLERAGLAALGAYCLVWFPLHDPATLFLGAMLAGSLCGHRRRLRDAQCPCGVARAQCVQLRHAVGAAPL